MVSKDPSSPGTSSYPTRSQDTSVAPYLTHIITHHGRVTLVPPQNQGRLQKNKRSHRVRAVRTEQVVAEASSTASRSTSSLRSPTRPSKEKSSQRYSHLSSDPSRTTLPEPQSSISLVHPPLSSAPLRSEVVVPPGNDVISLCSSSSSDDFEGLIALLKSQWELDRMTGLTLEECTHRKLNRRRTAMNAMRHSPVSPSVCSGTHSPPPPSPKDLFANEMRLQGSAVSLPSVQGNRLKSIPVVQSRRSKPDPPHPPSTERNPESGKSSVKTFSRNGHTLKPAKEDPLPLTQSNSDHLVSTWGDMSTSGFRKVFSDSESTEEFIIHPAVSESIATTSAMGECRGGLSGSLIEETENVTVVPRSTDFRSVSSSPHPLSNKGKGREMALPDNFAAIHNRPLPIPCIPQEPRHSEIRPLVTSSSPWVDSSSLSAFQVNQASKTLDIPSGPLWFSRRPVPPPVTSLFDVSVHNSTMGVRSVHNWPVPPPLPDFARATRKPLPTPPFSYALRASGSRDHGVCVSQSPDTVTRSKSIDFEFQTSPPRTTPPRTPRSPPECRDQDFRAGGDVVGSVTTVTDQGSCDSAACAHGLIRESDTIAERRNSSTTHEITSLALPVVEEVSIQARVAETSRDALLDDPSVVNSPPDPRPSSDEGLSPNTDIDLLLSRLDESSSRPRYEDLLIVGELFGPAQPQYGPRITEDLPLGKSEVVRRRKLQEGRVKVKLSLLGVTVDRCGICLSQFKDAEWAVLLPCLHSSHSTCLDSWLVRSHTCPLCRGNLDTS